MTEQKEERWTRDEESRFVIRPRLPVLDGIFNLEADVLIASHTQHERINEHLHDHLYHMHIRYGFEIPAQSFRGIGAAALEVAMMVKVEHRVDCNPVFVARGRGAEGVSRKIGGEDVHWVHNDEVGEKATKLYANTGRKVKKGYRFSGFRTAICRSVKCAATRATSCWPQSASAFVATSTSGPHGSSRATKRSSRTT